MLSSHRSFRCAILLLALCSTSVLIHAQSAPPAQTASSAQLDQILSSESRARTIAQVAVSPDGKRFAWLQAGEIRVAPLERFWEARPVTTAAPGQSCNASDLVWSPDSTSIAFLSDCDEPGQPDLFLSHLDGSAALRLTHLQGYVDAPAFSPDGHSIAFLYVEGATRPSGALAAETPASGVIGEDHVEIQRVAAVLTYTNWKPDETPAQTSKQPPDAHAANLFSAFSFITPPNLHVFEFDWSPDSKSLAYIAADPPGENNWWVAKLYTEKDLAALGYIAGACVIDGHGGCVAPPVEVLAPADISGPLHGLQIAVPRWSPDGKSIAFIGGLMSDQGVVGGDVWLIDSACGEPSASGSPSTCGPPVNLTPNRPTSAQWLTWDGNDAIYISELAGGDSRVTRLRFPQTRGAPADFDLPLFNVPGSIGAIQYDTGLSVISDRSLFVFQASTFDRAPEIYAAHASLRAMPSNSGNTPPGFTEGFAGFTQLSNFNDAVKPSWGDSVSLSWKNDNFDIQGWLLFPAHYDPAKKYPLLVEVHGGPASSVVSSWDGGEGGFSATAFSSLGYFVFMPNPRGSYGQGEAFTEANRKDFGYGDLRDILAGVDTVLAKYPVDPNRIGIAGWSYGGFMTMFAITQTHRFRAAVAGAGISDWLSYYGENSIDQWMIPYFGASVYDDPAIYAKSSAITFIKQAETPTLTLVGDRDGECPAPQSFEFWHALRDLHVPAQLVVYANEGHGFSDPSDRRDVLERAVDWFARYMPPNP
jgi:dipeptidyl aminopeptidase/acylaminoacyl peptidase